MYIIFMLALAIIPGYMIFESMGYGENMLDKYSGPAMMPQTIATIWLVLIGIQILRYILSNNKKNPKFISLFKGNSLFFLVSILAYAICYDILGYLFSTIIFSIGAMLYLEKKSEGVLPKKSIIRSSIIGLSLALGTYIFFVYGAGISMPKGFLGI